MDIVPGLGHLVPDWALWVLVPFVAALLIANQVFRVRERRNQSERRRSRAV